MTTLKSIGFCVGWIITAYVGLWAMVLYGVTKGTQVFISGSIKQSRYEKDGEKKSSVLVLVDRIVVVNRDSENNHSDDYGDIPF